MRFHCRISHNFCCHETVDACNLFYSQLMKEYKFNKKPALIGLSRGGLYCYNWAIANPDKVVCIYGDAPVCDFKAWPGDHFAAPTNGSPRLAEWKKMLTAYHFKSDAEAFAYRGNPVDNLKS